MTTHVTTSPGGYEAHDRRKRLWLQAERGKRGPETMGDAYTRWGDANDFRGGFQAFAARYRKG